MINIMFCGNDGVFDGMLTCALSIFKRSDTSEGVRFYILTMDVSHIKPNYTPICDDKIKFFEDVVKSYGEKNEVVKIDVTDLYKNEFAGCPNEGAYCSPFTLIRLFADEIDGLPDKANVAVYNVDGKLLFTQQATGGRSTSILMTAYPAGNYIINAGGASFKFVKQ